MQTLFLKCLYPKPNNSTFLCFFSSLSSLSHSRTSNPSLSKCIIETLAFSEPRAVSISNRFPPSKTLQKPLAVVQLLRQFGLTDVQIQSSVRVAPQILFSDVEKTLKRKLQFFQDLGLTGPELAWFNSHKQLACTVLNHMGKRQVKGDLVGCVICGRTGLNFPKKIIENKWCLFC